MFRTTEVFIEVKQGLHWKLQIDHLREWNCSYQPNNVMDDAFMMLPSQIRTEELQFNQKRISDGLKDDSFMMSISVIDNYALVVQLLTRSILLALIFVINVYSYIFFVTQLVFK